MALFDAKLEFSDDQDISMAAGSTASSNTFNFGQAGLEMGAGEPMWLNVKIGTEGVVDGTTDSASTLVVKLVNDVDTTMDTDSEIMYQSRVFTQDEMTAGDWLVRIPLPYDIDKNKVMGVLYTIAGATSTLGTVDAWVDNGPSSSFDVQVSASNI